MMSISPEGTVSNTSYEKEEDIGKETEFLPYPLLVAGSKTQIYIYIKRPGKHIRKNK